MASFRSYLHSLPASRLVVALFFGLLLLTGLLLHRDYGVSVDEPVDRRNGMINIKYVGELLAPELTRQQSGYELLPALKGYGDNDHGVAFEVPMALLNLAFTRGNTQASYRLRHFCIFLVFVAGTYGLFGLAKLRFRSWKWGLLAALLLVLSPRFFAEAFYNAKDIVFMAFFTLSIYTLTRLLQRPAYSRALLHALVTAVAIDVRILGIMSVAFTLGMAGLELLIRPAPERAFRLRLLKVTLLYLAAAAVFVLVGWPALWEAPLTQFWNTLRGMSHFSWHTKMLYLGEFVFSNQLPWHYIPVWIAITTPVPYLLAAGVGLLTEVRGWLRQPRSYLATLEHRLGLLLILWLFGPVLLVILLQSVVYNGWRHLYFVYPALLLLAVQGIRAVVQWSRQSPARRRLAYALLVLGLLETGHTAVRMIRAHPHQQVYFSFLPPEAVVRLFDRDYWGLSYRQGLEWILAQDTSPKVTYCGDPWMLYCGSLLLAPEQKARLQYVWNANSPEVRYFLTAYRPHNYPHSYPDSVGLGREVHTIRVEGVPILSVYQQR